MVAWVSSTPCVAGGCFPVLEGTDTRVLAWRSDKTVQGVGVVRRALGRWLGIPNVDTLAQLSFGKRDASKVGSMKRAGRIHLKVLFILVGLVGLLGAGVVVVHYVQKSRIAARALTEGQAAFKAQRWVEAARHLKTIS